MKIVFMGTPVFAVSSLEAILERGDKIELVITQEDKPRDRGKKIQMPAVKEKALEMGLEVYSVERIKELHFKTASLLRKLGYYRIALKLDDGTMGWPEEAPYDRIIVTAGGPEIPNPLVEQLADPGILIIPVGGKQRAQTLLALEKKDGKIIEHNLGAVSFVNLVGNYGW